MDLTVELYCRVLKFALDTFDLNGIETRHLALLGATQNSRGACLTPSIDNGFLAMYIAAALRQKVSSRAVAQGYQGVHVDLVWSSAQHNDGEGFVSEWDVFARVQFLFQARRVGSFTFQLECSSYSVGFVGDGEADAWVLSDTFHQTRHQCLRDDETLQRIVKERGAQEVGFHREAEAPRKSVRKSLKRLVLLAIMKAIPRIDSSAPMTEPGLERIRRPVIDHRAPPGHGLGSASYAVEDPLKLTKDEHGKVWVHFSESHCLNKAALRMPALRPIEGVPQTADTLWDAPACYVIPGIDQAR